MLIHSAVSTDLSIRTQENYGSFSSIIPLTQNGKKLDKDCPKGGRGSKGEEPTLWAQLERLRRSEPGVPPSLHLRTFKSPNFRQFIVIKGNVT